MQKRRLTRIKKPKIDLSRPRSIKLSISVGIFLALVLIKLFDPNGAAQMSSTIDEYIGDKTPITLEALGKAVTGGENLLAVFKNLSDVITGKSHDVAAATDDVITLPETEPDTGAPPEQTDIQTSEQTSDPELFSSEYQASSLTSRSMPWRGNEYEIEIVSEGELSSGADFGIDDTLPLPFGYDAPPNVDYTKYELSFEYGNPVNGVESSGFGYRLHPIKNETLFHYGTDIAANTGTNIQAFAAGKVAAAGNSKSYGNYLLIEHKDGVSSFYAHCSKVLVKKGATIKLGQIVAKVGSTGQSTGPHLHFELRREGKILDPEHYV